MSGWNQCTIVTISYVNDTSNVMKFVEQHIAVKDLFIGDVKR